MSNLYGAVHEVPGAILVCGCVTGIYHSSHTAVRLQDLVRFLSLLIDS